HTVVRFPQNSRSLGDPTGFHEVLQSHKATRHPTGVIRMIDEIYRLMDRYLVWLKDTTSLREVNDWVEITTPYLDRHNDFLQIYAPRENGGYTLTDDGFIME